ncbi:dTDP-4-dehydrorhamnose 3,5-epimerase [Enterobacter roggenkampii]|mgnify:CR=1 FL=1|uniref:dTDP-4-dehydrorhamnose 3,5-epimerase n=1 Tax=Enterobacter roggenkampii TaxID=1812935 RepID=UPI0020036761|nr:dTDP-4-dehydrorhamnose 3,5-epimerase [Enterobacter roggenkampii]MCK6936057.1 dTDP-4-dehydrorhamnose 3,5-epimerase [Enterobacter roggenkampii]HAS0881937.1 dTDP-4-dehydrorhamnose 3,5-epimerase [Enterobacter roggenkampii]
MNVIKTAIPEVLIFEPKVYGDSRGFFFESYNENVFSEATNRKVDFVQDNHSKSKKGVLRGLHYQLEPYSQGKLVRCIVGEVFDVAVDIRRTSETFGKWVGVNLSAQNKRQLWIPEGFAHGFLVLSEEAEFVYKTTAQYSVQHERCILWNDEVLSIDWPINNESLIISDKDLSGENFSLFF